MPETEARSNSDGVAIRYVLPVLWETSCFSIMGPVAAWCYRSSSLCNAVAGTFIKLLSLCVAAKIEFIKVSIVPPPHVDDVTKWCIGLTGAIGLDSIEQVTKILILNQGRTQEGADGAKAPPEIPRKSYLLIQIRSILCFTVCTKKSVSQSFYNNRLYRLTFTNNDHVSRSNFRVFFSVNMHIKLLSPAAFLRPKCTKYRLAGELTALPRSPSWIEGDYF